MYMRIFSIICMLTFLVAKTSAELTAPNELKRIMSNAPQSALRVNSEHSGENHFRGCISYESGYYGLLSESEWSCLTRDPKGRIVLTHEFSPLFTNASNMVELGEKLITSNPEMTPDSWDVRDGRVCLIKQSTEEPVNCLTANLEEDVPFSSLQCLDASALDAVSKNCSDMQSIVSGLSLFTAGVVVVGGILVFLAGRITKPLKGRYRSQ